MKQRVIPATFSSQNDQRCTPFPFVSSRKHELNREEDRGTVAIRFAQARRKDPASKQTCIFPMMCCSNFITSKAVECRPCSSTFVSMLKRLFKRRDYCKTPSACLTKILFMHLPIMMFPPAASIMVPRTRSSTLHCRAVSRSIHTIRTA